MLRPTTALEDGSLLLAWEDRRECDEKGLSCGPVKFTWGFAEVLDKDSCGLLTIHASRRWAKDSVGGRFAFGSKRKTF